MSKQCIFLCDDVLSVIFNYLVLWNHRLTCKNWYNIDVKYEPFRKKLLWNKYNGKAEQAIDNEECVKYILNDKIWFGITNIDKYYFKSKQYKKSIFSFEELNELYGEKQCFINEKILDFATLNINKLIEKYAAFIISYVKYIIKSNFECDMYYVDKLLKLTQEPIILKTSLKCENLNVVKYLLYKNVHCVDDIKIKSLRSNLFCTEIIKYLTF